MFSDKKLAYFVVDMLYSNTNYWAQYGVCITLDVREAEVCIFCKLCEGNCRSFIVRHPHLESVDKFSFHVFFKIKNLNYLLGTSRLQTTTTISEVNSSFGCPMFLQIRRFLLLRSHVKSVGAFLQRYLLPRHGGLSCLMAMAHARDIMLSAEEQISLLQCYPKQNPKLHISTPLAFFYTQICLYSKPDNVGPFLINVFKEHI